VVHYLSNKQHKLFETFLMYS